jgi:ATP-dependent NAD(P)H-hydrate dehydratase
MSSSSSSFNTATATATATAAAAAAATETGTWSQDTNSRQKAMERCIVPLSASSYKGSSGRVGVLGGSARYTGAPYYAAMASLKVGADLAFCFCAEEAAIPLKSYSPELMVIPVYKASTFDEAVLYRPKQQQQQDTTEVTKIDETENDDNNYDKEAEQLLVKEMVEEVCSMMDKMHVLVLGPGLGRCPLVLEATAQIIRTAQSKFHLPLVIDADALFLLTLPKYRNNLLSNDSSVILTPNAMELKRMKNNNNLPDRCLIIEKGAVDVIRPANLASSSNDNSSSTTGTVMTCDEVGGLKRSGGIGDILAGTTGTLVAWNNILTNRGKATYDDLPLSCWTACCFVRRTTKVAFDRHRRSMTAPDILEELGPVIDHMTTSAEEDNI